MEEILGIGLSVLSGGLTGILGTALSGVFKIFTARAEREEANAKRAHELALNEQNIRAGQQETENELRIIEGKTSAEQLVASYAHDMNSGQASLWVTNVLRLVRPFLTTLYTVIAAVIYFTMAEDSIVDGLSLKQYVIYTIVYTASATTLWWFGDRAQRPGKK